MPGAADWAVPSMRRWLTGSRDGHPEPLRPHRLPAERGRIPHKNSAQFHAHLGFTLAGTFHNCGYKFGRWYDMICMEKIIGEHKPDQPDVVPYPY